MCSLLLVIMKHVFAIHSKSFMLSLIFCLLAVIVLFAIMCFAYCRKRALEKVVVETDDDYDIRENVMYYDEEGAGLYDRVSFSFLPVFLSLGLYPLRF